MIDLHIHTIYSDGDKTVKEILKMCEERRLEYISITDHNSCEAYCEKNLKCNKVFSGKIIIGSELGAEFQRKSIEILAYGINPKVIIKWKEKYYSIENVKENTQIIYNRFKKILDKKNIIFDEDAMRPQKDIYEYIERVMFEEIIKHPENKRIIGEEYFNSWILFLRKELTNPKSEYFLNRVSTYPKVEEVVNIVHIAGGKAFLAHPFEYKFEDTIGFINDLRKEVKLDGIECFHPSSANDNKKDILVEYARKNNLYISGGSDYHGKLKPDIEIGIGRGNLNISKEIIEEWINE